MKILNVTFGAQKQNNEAVFSRKHTSCRTKFSNIKQDEFSSETSIVEFCKENIEKEMKLKQPDYKKIAYMIKTLKEDTMQNNQNFITEFWKRRTEDEKYNINEYLIRINSKNK